MAGTSQATTTKGCARVLPLLTAWCQQAQAREMTQVFCSIFVPV
jgi:hypothetical protein